MHPLVEMALVNSAIATLLAIVAAFIGLTFRRPTLTHIVWVLVLIKLVTPPIWHIPLLEREWVSRPVQTIGIAVQASLADPEPTPSTRTLPKDRAEAQLDVARSRPRTLPPVPARTAMSPRSWMAAGLAWSLTSAGQRWLIGGLLTVWGVGSITWFFVQGTRCLRFRRTLQSGEPAPDDVQSQLARMAERCGGGQVPLVWLLPGTLSPMLWGSGRSTLLVFPEALLDRLDAAGRETLLAHELAHFRRGDHWVRFVTLFATGLFWWHPIVWWARREIEAAEEECCDAWVVTHGAAAPRRYAEAILETVDFLAEQRWRVPPLATGLGQLPFLRQRLIWIMRGPRRQDLSDAGRVLCVMLAITLPLQPTWLAAKSAGRAVATTIPATPFEGGSVFDLPATTTDSVGAPAVTDLVTAGWDVTPGRASAGEVSIRSTDGRFSLIVGTSRQWFVDRADKRLVELSAHRIRAATFAPDGLSFVSGGLDGVVRLWNAESSKQMQAWRGASGPITSVAVSPDGCWIASGSRDGVVRLWQVGAQSAVRELPRESAPVNCVRFSADGRELAVATGDPALPIGGRIVVWNSHGWFEQTSMNWNLPTAAVAFGDDGRSLFSGDWQGRVARWSVETGELLGFVEGQRAVVAAAEVSPESSRLAEVNVPDLPLNFFVGDATQDEYIKSVFERLSRRLVPATLPSTPVADPRRGN